MSKNVVFSYFTYLIKKLFKIKWFETFAWVHYHICTLYIIYYILYTYMYMYIYNICKIYVYIYIYKGVM